jgi:hypothetical protein
LLDHIANEHETRLVVPKDQFLAQYHIPSKLASLTPERELQVFMPFAGDLPDNNFAANKAAGTLSLCCCLPAVLGLLCNTFCFSASFVLSWYNSCQTLSSCLIFRRLEITVSASDAAQYLILSKLASLTPERELQIVMPFAGDLPDNNFAAYKAEMVRWKCKWKTNTEKPSTLIDTLKHAKQRIVY